MKLVMFIFIIEKNGEEVNKVIVKYYVLFCSGIDCKNVIGIV